MAKLQMIFEMVNGKPVPRLPRDEEGDPRLPDGVKYLSPEQAAKRSGFSAGDLIDLWLSTFQELLPPTDVQLILEPADGRAMESDNAEWATNIRERLGAAILKCFSSSKVEIIWRDLIANDDDRPDAILTIGTVEPIALYAIRARQAAVPMDPGSITISRYFDKHPLLPLENHDVIIELLRASHTTLRLDRAKSRPLCLGVDCVLSDSFESRDVRHAIEAIDRAHEHFYKLLTAGEVDL